MPIQKTLLILALLLTGLWVPARAEVTELARIETKAGPLRLVQDGPERVFIHKNREILKGSDYMDVYRFFRPKKDYDGLLVKDYTGPIACPLQFRLIVLRPEGDVKVLPAFGHCADPPDLSLKGDTITISFKAFGDQPPAAWVFDGRSFKKQEPASPRPAGTAEKK